MLTSLDVDFLFILSIIIGVPQGAQELMLGASPPLSANCICWALRRRECELYMLGASPPLSANGNAGAVEKPLLIIFNGRS